MAMEPWSAVLLALAAAGRRELEALVAALGVVRPSFGRCRGRHADGAVQGGDDAVRDGAGQAQRANRWRRRCRPTLSLHESPRVAGTRPEASSTLITARSDSGSVPTTLAVKTLPSLVRTSTAALAVLPVQGDHVGVGEDVALVVEDDAGAGSAVASAGGLDGHHAGRGLHGRRGDGVDVVLVVDDHGAGLAGAAGWRPAGRFPNSALLPATTPPPTRPAARMLATRVPHAEGGLALGRVAGVVEGAVVRSAGRPAAGCRSRRRVPGALGVRARRCCGLGCRGRAGADGRAELLGAAGGRVLAVAPAGAAGRLGRGASSAGWSSLMVGFSSCRVLRAGVARGLRRRAVLARLQRLPRFCRSTDPVPRPALGSQSWDFLSSSSAFNYGPRMTGTRADVCWELPERRRVRTAGHARPAWLPRVSLVAYSPSMDGLRGAP